MRGEGDHFFPQSSIAAIKVSDNDFKDKEFARLISFLSRVGFEYFRCGHCKCQSTILYIIEQRLHMCEAFSPTPILNCLNLLFVLFCFFFSSALAPIWEQLASSVSQPTSSPSDRSIHIGQLDATVEFASAKRFDIRSFPSLKLFRQGKMFDYKGPRTLEALEKFVRTGGEGSQPTQIPEPPTQMLETERDKRTKSTSSEARKEACTCWYWLSFITCDLVGLFLSF